MLPIQIIASAVSIAIQLVAAVYSLMLYYRFHRAWYKLLLGATMTLMAIRGIVAMHSDMFANILWWEEWALTIMLPLLFLLSLWGEYTDCVRLHQKMGEDKKQSF